MSSLNQNVYYKKKKENKRDEVCVCDGDGDERIDKTQEIIH